MPANLGLENQVLSVSNVDTNNAAQLEWKTVDHSTLIREFNPNTIAYSFSEFNGQGDFTSVQSGTGAGSTFTTVGGELNHPGICDLSTGTTTSGRAHIGSASIDTVELGTYANRFVCSGKLTLQLSNSTDNYTEYVGFYDSFDSAPTYGLFFRYNHSNNSAKWEAVSVRTTTNNTTETTVDTGITAAIDTWIKFEIKVNAAADEVKFYMNGALVATINTNIPVGSTELVGFGWNKRKTAGTTAVSSYVDYMLYTADVNR